MKENKLKLRRNSWTKVAMKIFFTKPTYNIMQKNEKQVIFCIRAIARKPSSED